MFVIVQARVPRIKRLAYRRVSKIRGRGNASSEKESDEKPTKEHLKMGEISEPAFHLYLFLENRMEY